MSPYEPIGGNGPQGSGRRSFGIFSQGNIINFVAGIYDFSNRIFPCHDGMLRENAGREIFIKNAWRKHFKIENVGRKNYEFLLQKFHTDSIPASYQLDKHQTKKSTQHVWNSFVTKHTFVGLAI